MMLTSKDGVFAITVIAIQSMGDDFIVRIFGEILVMFYFSVYKSPEFSKRKIKVIAFISSILTIIIILILGHLMWILLTK